MDRLTIFFLLSVLCHGVFFVREWLVFGCGLFSLLIWQIAVHWGKEFDPLALRSRSFWGPAFPLVAFVGMMILSLLGLIHPVRASEGWLEAWRWLLYLLVYLWGRNLSALLVCRERLLNQLINIGAIITLITWLPGSERIWLQAAGQEAGRFAASFGYPNAWAVFVGFLILLLLGKEKGSKGLFFLLGFSFLATGSRGATVLLLFFGAVLLLKRRMIRKQAGECLPQALPKIGFYQKALWLEGPLNYKRLVIHLCLFFALMAILQFHSDRFASSLAHLLNWKQTSWSERWIYYQDTLILARWGGFLPHAGGWLAFPFVQTLPYWTLDPHSAFSRILLNQGLPGILLSGIWALKGALSYGRALVRGKDLPRLAGMTAVCYLGFHSLMDVDMSFGALGFLFWLLVGTNSK